MALLENGADAINTNAFGFTVLEVGILRHRFGNGTFMRDAFCEIFHWGPSIPFLQLTLELLAPAACAISRRNR